MFALISCFELADYNRFEILNHMTDILFITYHSTLAISLFGGYDESDVTHAFLEHISGYFIPYIDIQC